MYGKGSTGRGIEELKQFCSALGDTVYVATSDKISSDRHYQIGNKIDHKVHAFLSRLFCKQAGFSIFYTYRLLRWIKKTQPDIIQLNNLHSNFINISRLFDFTAKNSIPVILVLDDCWFYTGNCCHYTDAKCYKWTESCGNCPQLKKWNKSFLYDGTNRNLSLKKKAYQKNRFINVVGVSQWITNEAKRSILSDSFSFSCIYNSVDTSIFKPLDNIHTPSAFKNKKIILGVATFWDNSKGLHHFNNLAENLDNDYQIILIGNASPKTIHPKIKQISYTHSIEELAYYYNLADVFVQMSTEESFGKVCAEALSCGTPIAVFNSTASPELVGPNCGFIAETNNVFDMQDKILNICSKPKSFYKDHCVNFAYENFEIKKNLSKYRKLYEEIHRSCK